MQTGVLERRLFYMPSFKIYGSVAGFYDYGPPGCAVKQYITQYWRQHFVLEEDMLQVLHLFTQTWRLMEHNHASMQLQCNTMLHEHS